MNKKMIAACAIGVLLVAALGFGIYNMIEERPMPITDASASTLPEEIASTSVPEAPAIAAPSSSIAPIVPAISSSAAEIKPETKPAPQPNVVTSTPNANGGKDYNTSRPEYSRPPEDETIYDEPEGGEAGDNGNTPGGSGQQDGNASDKPQGGGNNTNTPGGGTEDKPQGDGQQGGKPGQVYVPGFGWMDDPGTGSGKVEIAENAGTGEVIGQ